MDLLITSVYKNMIIPRMYNVSSDHTMKIKYLKCQIDVSRAALFTNVLCISLKNSLV